MSNSLLEPKVYANTMLKLLKNNLVMGRLTSSTFKNEFKKKNSKIYVRRPPEFLVREGRIAQIQDVIEGEVEVKLDRQSGVDIEFTSLEETLTVDKLLKDETMNSKAATLAQYIDSALMEKVLEFPNFVGDPTETIDSVTDYSEGPKRLDQLAVPEDGNRNGVLSINDAWALANSLNNHPADSLSVEAVKRARIPMLGGTDAYKSQSVINLTVGTRAASGEAVIAGADQDVTYASVADDYTQTLNLSGLTNGDTVVPGEVFSVQNVNAVNPRTKQTTGSAAQFVVLVGGTAAGGGLLTVTIANPMIVGGAYATVDAAPANGAAVTWLGAEGTTFANNAVFHKSAIQLTFAKLVMPRTGRAAYSVDKETGIAIRYWETSDGTNDTHLHRWDILFGTTNVDRRLGTRLGGTGS